MNRAKLLYAKSILPCLGRSLLCGVVTGLAVFLFKLAARYAEGVSQRIFTFSKTSPLLILLVFALLALAAFLMVFLHKAVPEAKGGGIPRSEGVVRGRLSFRWAKTLLATVGGSLLSYLCGLPVGTEGPAVLIGTALGDMSSAKANHREAVRRYVMSGGAGAGFAVATGAPLSAILFALEELHKRFTPVLLMNISTAVLGAVGVNNLLCSACSLDTALLHLPAINGFEMRHLGWLLGLGLFITFAVALFERLVTLYGAAVSKHSLTAHPLFKMLLVFGATGLLGFVFADGIYSGHDIILLATENRYTLGLLAVLFALRLLMMLLITDSGATGGIFIPTLAIGALAGAFAAKLFTQFGLPQQLFASAVVLGMCAFIGGTLRAPLTAAVLFVELTGQFTDLFYAAVVIFTVNCLTELINQLPFYDAALDKMEEQQNRNKVSTIAHFELTVDEHSFVAYKPVRNILWPSSAVIHSITRANTDLIKLDRDGERRLHPGDRVVIRLRYYDRKNTVTQLSALVGTPIKELTL